MTKSPETEPVYLASRVEGVKKVERSLEFIKVEYSHGRLGKKYKYHHPFLPPIAQGYLQWKQDDYRSTREKLGERSGTYFVYTFTSAKWLLLNDVL